MYLEAASVDKFDLRSAVGGQWSLALRDKLLKDAYEAVGNSYAAQRAFRKEWANKQDTHSRRPASTW